MALFPPLDQDPEEVRRLLEPLRNDISVAIYNHQNPFSVGGIIRVAHSFLVRDIHIIGDEPYYEKASMGMHKYETIHKANDTTAFLNAVAGRPLWAIEKDHATIGLWDVEQWPRDAVLVFGSERFGLPNDLVQAADQVVGIPMFGVNHSFPVSVCVGMVLCEWARHRYAPGTIVSAWGR